jgi:hypothetical protein
MATISSVIIVETEIVQSKRGEYTVWEEKKEIICNVHL